MDVQGVGAAAAADQQSAPPVPGLPPVTAQPDDSGLSSDKTKKTDHHSDPKTLSPVAAHLFAQNGDQHHANVNVSYRSENGKIVTVFTDPATGKEITQVPSELLVQLAQFFDKHNGVTLDKTA